MTASDLLVILLYFPALARVTKLVNDDLITDPIRAWAARKLGPKHTLMYLLECPWCMSIWLGAATTPLITEALRLPWWWILLLTLAGSYFTGLASRLHGDPDEIPIETP